MLYKYVVQDWGCAAQIQSLIFIHPVGIHLLHGVEGKHGSVELRVF
jgi:hypothetical protein